MSEVVLNKESNLVNMNYSNRVSIISGPNGSGKTVYLRQISLIIYMAHCGLRIPAEFAEIPLIDRIILVNNYQSIHQDFTTAIKLDRKN